MENGNIQFTDWVPVKTGLYPKDDEIVRVTYNETNRYGDDWSDRFAFRKNGKWFWSYDQSKVKAKIIAWKYEDDLFDPGKYYPAAFPTLFQQMDNKIFPEAELYERLLNQDYTCEDIRKYMGNKRADRMYEFCIKKHLINPSEEGKQIYYSICKCLTKNHSNCSYGIEIINGNLVTNKKKHAKCLINLFKSMKFSVVMKKKHDGKYHIKETN